MTKLRSISPAALCVALLVSATFFGPVAIKAQTAAPAARITAPIDENQLVTLKGNTHPAANSKNDQGPVSPNLRMTDLILVLSRGPQQQAAFDAFVTSQYDETSPNFHQWLTPDQVGTQFGPAPADIATISGWLASHGFSVDEVTKDHMSIRFSGTASQVQSAFHTEIHNLTVSGKPHIANMSDPQIPAALAPAIVGVKALHDFTPKPLHHMGSAVQRDASTGLWKKSTSAAGTGKSARPQFVTTDQYQDLLEDVGPYDFATIYNLLPLWNASTPTDGTGQKIAIAGTSDINPSDVAAFRLDFGLPTNITANTPIQMKGVNGLDPEECTANSGVCTIDDLIENSLDVEWSGSIAKNAQIILVTSGAQSATDDTVYDSASYVIQHSVAPILNVSYGLCELGEGTVGNVSYYNLWQTAATEGISVFVASGDSGSASCDDGYNVADYGLTVSGLASTPWNTAVGGTDLYWCSVPNQWNGTCTSSAAQYWNTTNATPVSTASAGYNAKGYITEVPWNDTCAGTLGFQFSQQIATYFGYSVNDAETGCNFDEDSSYYTGYNFSSLVEVVGGSGGASGCVVNNTNPDGTTFGTCTAGSTSTGNVTTEGNESVGPINLNNNGWQKPTWQAGVPGIPNDSVRDIPDVSFFAADGFLGSAYLICVSEGGYSCTYSNIAEPIAQEVGGTSVATPAMAGVMALINQKLGSAQGFANKELYALAAKQNYSSCSAEAVSNSSSCYFNDIDGGPFTPAYNNAVPCENANSSSDCPILHSGDPIGIIGTAAGTPGYNSTTGYDLATGLGSLNITNVVNNWTSTIGTGPTTVTVTPASGSIAVNQPLMVTVTVTGNPTISGNAPSGSVTLSSGAYTSAPGALTTSGTSGTYTFTIPASTLSGGTDTLTVSYAGDSNYAPKNGSNTVTVTKLTASVSAIPSQGAINSNQTLIVTGTVTGTGGTATGSVYVTSGAYTSSASTLSSGSYSITINPNSLPVGATPNSVQSDTLTVNYSGDANYTATTGSTSVNVTYIVVQTPTVLVVPAASTWDSGSPLLVTVTVSGTNGTPTGAVTVTANGTAQAPANLTAGVAKVTIPANTLSTSPSASDTISAHYQGDPNYNQADGSATVTVTQSAYSLSAAAVNPNPVAPGSTATTSISVNSTTDYTGTVTFNSASCVLISSPSGAVSLPTCALTGSGAVTVTNGTASGPVTYTVTTTSTSTASLADRPAIGPRTPAMQLAKTTSPANPNAPPSRGTELFGAASGAALAALFLFLIPGGARKWSKMLGAILVIVALTFAIEGCGGGNSGGSTGPTQGAPTVTITATPSSVTLGSSTTVSVQITVAGSSGTPTGSVSFSGGGYTSTSQTLSSGTYTYSLPASDFTTVGTDTLTANYSGNTNYISNSGTTSFAVNNIATTAGAYTFTVTAASSPSFTAQPSTTFTVNVNVN